jgi:hypothetical protein
MAPATLPSQSARPTREQLQNEIRSVLPPEAMEYTRMLNDRRFGRHPGADQLFFVPGDLVTLLAQAVISRGSLNGDDREGLLVEGINPCAFELPDTYQYLKVPAEGRAGLLSIEELPHWVPVTLRQDAEPNTRIGFRRSPDRHPDQHLIFTIDADFQRMANYATILLAPNWFEEASTPRAVLDVYLGPPVPSKLQSICLDDPVVLEQGWADGSEVQVHELRQLLGDRPIWLSCRNRNLPGT